MSMSERNPIATYERAIWRLVCFQTIDQATDEEIEYAVRIVADVFWLSDAKVRHDMRRSAKEIDYSFAPARDRRFTRGGF